MEGLRRELDIDDVAGCLLEIPTPLAGALLAPASICVVVVPKHMVPTLAATRTPITRLETSGT